MVIISYEKYLSLLLARYLHLLTWHLHTFFTSSFLHMFVGKSFPVSGFLVYRGLPTNPWMDIIDFHSRVLSKSTFHVKIVWNLIRGDWDGFWGKHSLCLSVLWWPCWDFIVALKSPTTLISQTTQVGTSSVSTGHKWNSQTQILKD